MNVVLNVRFYRMSTYFIWGNIVKQYHIFAIMCDHAVSLMWHSLIFAVVGNLQHLASQTTIIQS